MTTHPELEHPLFHKAIAAIAQHFGVSGRQLDEVEMQDKVVGIVADAPDVPDDIFVAAFKEWLRDKSDKPPHPYLEKLRAEQLQQFQTTVRYARIEPKMYDAIDALVSDHSASSAEKLHELFLDFIKVYLEQLNQTGQVEPGLLVKLFSQGATNLLEKLPPNHELRSSNEYQRLQKPAVLREYLREWGLLFDE
jgi:hypothetical protein